EPRQTRGLPEPVIQELIDAFLVRAEDRRGSTWYELAHDRLIEPVREDNSEWRQRHLHPSLLLATDWERANRPNSLLLHDPELKEVESWASTNDVRLTDAEREFIRSSRTEERRKRRRQLAYVYASSLTFLGLVAILGIILYFWRNAVSERRNAESARDAARDQRRLAEQRALEAKLRACELTIDRGISLCQQGRTDDGLLWLVRGLERVPEQKTHGAILDHLARLELAAWRAELTSLRWFQRSRG